MRSLDEFEKKIGYKFKNRNLLITALTHSSYANESRGSDREPFLKGGQSFSGTPFRFGDSLRRCFLAAWCRHSGGIRLKSEPDSAGVLSLVVV